ncbi:MAG: CDP-alcohol phosphatidyltransferase family protein [Thermodesulfobacteriota bacterium]|nr:CDP-alcohol phosphatidyltransferase family protein [Thermodesulfobacteriota bacterium]
MNLPNLLTLTRVLLIPVFVIFIIDKSYLYALITFAIAGITDGIDGLIARLTHQKTELGAYLDPIADKLLLLSGFIALAITEILPSWIAVIVITRDVIILMGIFVMILINRRPKIQPSLVSKLTTDFQIATVLLALLRMYYPFFNLLSTVAIYGTALLTIISGSHYIYVGTRILNQKKSTRMT